MYPNSSGVATRIAEFAHRADVSTMPPEVLRHARAAVKDAFGVALLGAGGGFAGPLLRWLAREGTGGPCRVIGTDLSTGPSHAALANGTLAHLLDYDDRGHSSTHGLATCLAVGQLVGASGAEVLTAFIVNREVRMALDRAIDTGRRDGRGPGARGWHSTGTHGPIASAAAAARLLGADLDTTVHAVAIATSGVSGLIANFGTLTKPLHAGRAAATGVTAALLATEGWDGSPAVFEEPGGFLEAICRPGEADADRVCAELGTLWDPGVRVKRYPSCTGTHPPVDVVLALHAVEPDLVDRVESITLDLLRFFLRYPEPRYGIQAKFSLPYCLSMALLDGCLTEDHFARFDEHIGRAKAVMGRIHDRPGSKDLELRRSDGDTVRIPLGAPLNVDAVDAKFLDNATPTVGADRAAELSTVLDRLDELPDLDDLLR